MNMRIMYFLHHMSATKYVRCVNGFTCSCRAPEGERDGTSGSSRKLSPGGALPACTDVGPSGTVLQRTRKATAVNRWPVSCCTNRRYMPRLCVTCFLCLVPLIDGNAAECSRSTPSGQIPPLADIIDGVKRTYSQMPCEYTGVRRYTLRNKRFGKSAEILVLVTYRRREGKSFKVLESQGSEELQRRVLGKLLDAEAEASRPHTWDARVTPENYGFRIIGAGQQDGRRCYIVHISPKVKSKYLIEGEIWVDAVDYAIVRMEGRPSESVSFWIGKPHVDQKFEKVGEFWLASHNQSTAESRLLGLSELNIEYGPYQLAGGELNVAGSGNFSQSNTAGRLAIQSPPAPLPLPVTPKVAPPPQTPISSFRW